MAGTPQGVLLADNLTEVLLAMGIWDSAVHQLWLWEPRQLGLEHAAETEGQEEDHLAMLADQVSESHLCQNITQCRKSKHGRAWHCILCCGKLSQF